MGADVQTHFFFHGGDPQTYAHIQHLRHHVGDHKGEDNGDHHPKQLALQFLVVVVTIVFTFVVTYVVAKVLDMSIGLRVTTMEEEVGLDISGHGERAYS